MLFFVVGLLLSYVIYIKLIEPCNYWRKRGVVQVKSWPLVGSLGEFIVQKTHMVDIVSNIYKQHPKERYVGFNSFIRPTLLLRDLDLIKDVCIKDFDYFPDHFALTDTKSDVLMSKNLISLRGDEWRQMRATLSPAFTSSKMRAMYFLMTECAEKFVEHFQSKETVELDMKDVFSRYTNDVIATTAFGIQVDSLSNPNNEFLDMGQTFTKFKAIQLMKALMAQMVPWLARAFNIQIFPQKVTDFFRTIIKETISKREKDNIFRPDLIHLLMEAKKGKLKHDHNKDERDTGFATVEESQIGKSNNIRMNLTDNDIVAQAFLFFFAGFDTLSTAFCFLAYELATHPDIQAKLQAEIDNIHSQYKGKVPYDVLLSMKFLDQVISETLRMWPPGVQTDRLCAKDYVIRAQRPEETSVVVEKGMSVVIPVMAIHRDPEYFPEPDRFDPDRFNDENKSKIIPGSYLPFGAGPRNCIGSRFALLEVKTLIFLLLSKLDIVTVDKTPIQLRFDRTKMNLLPEGGFWMAFKPRKTTTDQG